MCGIVGILREKGPVSADLYVALLNLQHRGKESAGVAIQNGGKIHRIARMGEVVRALPPELATLVGSVGIAQNRYSTTGLSNPYNMQPVGGCFKKKSFFLVHNGNLVNTVELKRLCHSNFCADASDTRVITYLISHSKKSSFEEAILEVIKKLCGSFNLIILFEGKLYVAKDRFGFHPLQLGQREEDYFVASESCAMDHCGAAFVRDVKPGEMIVISKGGIESNQWTEDVDLKFDIFEFIYFSRPDSVIHGVEVGSARYEMGRRLAWGYSYPDADIVIPIPDSGNEAALGFFEESSISKCKLEFKPWALFRPHTVSRTFIEPVKKYRERSLSMKFNPRPHQLEGKIAVCVDDSLIRGNTSSRVAQILRRAGVRKIHWLLSSPPYKFPDLYGIDTYRQDERLVAKECKGDLKVLARLINVDSVAYLNLTSTISAVLSAKQGEDSPLDSKSFYSGPFSGEYPDGIGDIHLTP